jgi:hypothetical protein
MVFVSVYHDTQERCCSTKNQGDSAECPDRSDFETRPLTNVTSTGTRVEVDGAHGARKRRRDGNATSTWVSSDPYDGVFLGGNSQNFLTFGTFSLRLKSAEHMDGWLVFQQSYS